MGVERVRKKGLQRGTKKLLELMDVFTILIVQEFHVYIYQNLSNYALEVLFYVNCIPV